MKRESVPKNYYEEYLEVCHSIAPKSELLNLRKLSISKDDIWDFCLPFGTCLVDYANRNYPYVSNNVEDIHSYPREKYINVGLDFHIGVWHPEDKVIFEEKVFHDIMEYWRVIPPGEFSKFRFSFNHRYYRSNGVISHLLQHSTYLEPQGNLPLINLATFSDIGDFKLDNTLIMTISRFVSGKGYVKVFSKTYSLQKKSVLSFRESEILRLSLDGLSSKMIADKLFISLQTVKNHKRNMMEKTSTQNISGLINISLKNNWI